MILTTVLSNKVPNFKDIYNKYLESTDWCLENCYKTTSCAKKEAYADCIYTYLKNNGHNFRIISHNVFMFTVGFIAEDKETGKAYFVYITPTKSLRIEL